MAFNDLIDKIRDVNLNDVQDTYKSVKGILNNPHDIINDIKNGAINKVLSTTVGDIFPPNPETIFKESFNDLTNPQFRKPTSVKIFDLSGLSLEQAETSFSVQLSTFSKVTIPGAAGKQDTSNNTIWRATVLPQPQNLVVSYPKSWGEDKGGGILGGDENASNFLFGDVLNKVGELVQSRSLLDHKVKNKVNHNDRLKVLFNNVPFRTFQFSFRLAPKSVKDQVDIKDFIKNMKWLSAPSLYAKGAGWKFPNTFQINFVTGTGGLLFKTLELACTDFSINYTPEGVWAQNKDGNPVAYEVHMSFMETKQITKEEISGGA